MSLSVFNVSKTFLTSKAGEEIHALEDINLEVQHEEFISIIGPSGCGKTTLLRIIAGLEMASKGEVSLDGKEITKPNRQVGMVFQDYALFSWRTVLENIELGLEIKRVPKREKREAALDYIKMFGLAGFERCYPKELSGGMQQRVAIARTLIIRPRVLLMDEPFAALDSQTRASLQEFLLKIWEKTRETIVFVTHNIDEAVFLSDHVIVLTKRPGQIKKIFNVSGDCPRPRDRFGGACNGIRKQILDFLKQEMEEGNDRAH